MATEKQKLAQEKFLEMVRNKKGTQQPPVENIEKEEEKPKEEEIKDDEITEIQDWVKKKREREKKESIDKIEKSRKKANKIQKENKEKEKIDDRWKVLTKTDVGGIIEWRKSGSSVIDGYVNGKPSFSIKRGINQYSLYTEDRELAKKLGNKYVGVEVSVDKLKIRAEKVMSENTPQKRS